MDENYTEVQRSQHLTQADPRIFGQSYVANVSSVNGRAAFLGEQTDHSHIDYFQSLEKFREPGLPCELPAHIEESLRQDPRRQELESEVRQCTDENSSGLVESKKRLASYVKSLKADALRQHQEDWIQRRRDWKIVTRGKEQHRTWIVPTLSRISVSFFLSVLVSHRCWRLMKYSRRRPDGSPWQTSSPSVHETLRCSTFPGCQPVKECCPVECRRLKLER